MKSILKIIGLAVGMAFGLTAQAGVTNVTYKITVEIAGVGTNSASLKLQQDGSAKDAKLVDGLVWYYNQYRAIPKGTNTTLEGWLKDETKNVNIVHATEKAVSDNAVRKQKLYDLLTSQADALSAGDLSSIDAIIAKWTAP